MPPEVGYRLVDASGHPFVSATPGQFGGHRKTRVYGRLDCPSALRTLARGGYVRQRVFFADEQIARAAGYRPCAMCLPLAYRAWKAARPGLLAPPELGPASVPGASAPAGAAAAPADGAVGRDRMRRLGASQSRHRELPPVEATG